MRVDICVDQDGTMIDNFFDVPEIEYGITNDLEKVYDVQSEYMKKTYQLEEYADCKIVPKWMDDISLVVIMHMEAFTGHIFHTYQKAYEDIKKIEERTNGKHKKIYLYTHDDELIAIDAEYHFDEIFAQIKNNVN